MATYPAESSERLASRRALDAVRSVVPVLEQLSFDEAFGEQRFEYIARASDLRLMKGFFKGADIIECWDKACQSGGSCSR